MITKYKKGSITVEAVIVIPIVLLATVITLYMVILLYEKNVLIAESHQLADQMAEYFNPKYEAARSEEGVVFKANNSLDLYWRFANRDDYMNKMMLTAQYNNPDVNVQRNNEGFSIYSEAYPTLKDKMILGGDVKVFYQYNKGFFSSEIIVGIDKNYDVPLFNMFLKDKFSMQEHVIRPIRDPVEFTRNIDLAGDLVTYIPGVKNIIKSYENVLDDIREFFSGA